MLPPPGMAVTSTLGPGLFPAGAISGNDMISLASASISFHFVAPTSTIAHSTAASTFHSFAIPSPSNSPTATIISAMSAVATALATGSAQGPSADKGSGECQLLGPFALFIQGALGLVAILSLVWKRYFERPQRPVKIWFFDVSKQIFGSVLLHIANLLMSMLSAGQLTVHPEVATGAVADPADDSYRPNPCSFYLLNLAIDTTIGIPILILLLRLLTILFLLTPLGVPPQSLQSGNYGQPPRTIWWLKQSLVYFVGLLGMKLCVLFIFTVLPWISIVGDWALSWTDGNQALQIGFVMLLFPCIMNAIQYWIIDGFIKDQKPQGMEAVAQEDNNDDDQSGTVVTQADAYDEDAIEGVDSVEHGKELPESKTKLRKKRSPDELIFSAEVHKYDPETDGEGSPTVLGSGSGSSGVSKAADNTPRAEKSEN